MIENNIPIIVGRHIFKMLKDEPHNQDLIALYIFYCDTALRQKTNKIHSTTEYTAKGLNWAISTVRRIKRRLVELDLIEETTAHRNAKAYIILKKFFQCKNDPIVLHRSIYRNLLQCDKMYPKLLTLYMFYYDIAKWQKTNKPKATNTYVCKGLNWGVAKQQTTRTLLTQLKYIEQAKIKKIDTKRYRAHYVKVHYIWSLHNTLKQIVNMRKYISKYGEVELIRNKKVTNIVEKNNFSKGVERPSTNALGPEKEINTLSPEKDLTSLNHGFFTNHNKKSKKEPIITKIDKFVEYWNSLPNTPKQNPSTKYYKETSKLFKELLSGTFSLKEKSLTHYCKQWNIPLPLPKLTPSEIYKALDNLALLFDENYLPHDKSSINKNLNLLIYNPYITNYPAKSIFLRCLFNKPKRINNIYEYKNYNDPNQIDFDFNDPKFNELNKNKKIIEIAKEALTNKNLSTKEEFFLYNNLVSLIEYNKNLPSNPAYIQNKVIRRYYPYGQPYKLIKEYIDYLRTQNWISEIGINLFKASSKIFKNFIKREEEDLGVSFASTSIGAMRI